MIDQSVGENSQSLSQSQLMPDDNAQRPRPDPLADAMSQIQAERDNSFQMAQRT